MRCSHTDKMSALQSARGSVDERGAGSALMATDWGKKRVQTEAAMETAWAQRLVLMARGGESTTQYNATQ